MTVSCLLERGHVRGRVAQALGEAARDGQGEAPSDLLEQLARFIAELHQAGVYFRSLHLGNVVLTPQGKLGLIDIADLSIQRWPLLGSQRLRNFRHMLRDARDPMAVARPFKLSAYRVELFDTISLTLDRYGWSAKTFMVVGRSWAGEGTIQPGLE